MGEKMILAVLLEEIGGKVYANKVFDYLSQPKFSQYSS